MFLATVAVIIAGVLVAFLVMTSGEYSKAHWVPSRDWLLMGLFTTITFSAIAIGFKASWHRVRFWVFILMLLILHIAAYTAALNWYQPWPAMFFFVASIAEAYGLESLLLKLGFVEWRSRSRRTES